MNDIGTLNYAWSQALAAGFAAAGATAAVISPGSRSTPLALALLRQPGIACHVVIDERSAAFFALGMAKASRRPVLLLATSGSAPANWLPAVIEASQAGVPLLLVSADRPPELQACGANQTIAQLELFGRHVRARHALAPPHPDFDPAWLHRLAAQACEEATWPLPGPVHINQPFREPLLPAAALPLPSIQPPIQPPAQPPALPPALPPAQPPALPAIAVTHAAPAPDAAAIAALAARMSGVPGAIVCGEADYLPGFATAVAALAARLDCPILAEPLSGLRFGPHDRSRVYCRYEAWLRDPAGIERLRPRWLLRFGAFPVTRALQSFAAAAETLALVDPLPRWSDPAHALTHLLRADPLAACEALLAAAPAACPPGWRETFAVAENRAAAAWTPDDAGVEGNLVPALLAALPAACPLFVGNSMAIRDLDAFGGSSAKPLPIFANRGASGIDGNVSTALGIAAARGRVVAMLGDLTCQHDLGGLAAAKGRNAVFVVLNNGGGGIFEYLPQANLPEFERAWLTPQAIDFAAAAATFGLDYACATTTSEFVAQLTPALAAGRPALIEIRIDRQASVARRKAWLEAARV